MSIRIALAGNPNCGKTTLFNELTGSNQYVGNWAGVTVEKKDGILKGHKDVIIQDLPGIYSLSPYTLEEKVARNYLVNEQPDVILNIIDGTNLERNLYLSTQLIEIGLPVVMAVNMMDLVKKSGDKIDIKKMGEELGCEVVEISALQGKGCKEAAERAIEAAKNPSMTKWTRNSSVGMPSRYLKETMMRPMHCSSILRLSLTLIRTSRTAKMKWTMIPNPSSSTSVTPISDASFPAS